MDTQLIREDMARLRAAGIPDGSRLGGDYEERISRYYTLNQLAYRFIHHPGGAIHMALNPDGQYHPDGFKRPARLIADRLPPGANVLELACGKGFNAQCLSEIRPDVNIYAVDLTPAHVKAAKRRNKGNDRIQILQADFHHLPFMPQTFDAVFSVESLCYAESFKQLFAEIRRVLKPDGIAIDIDGWRKDEFTNMPEEVQQAGRWTEQSMAVEHGDTEKAWEAEVLEGGMEVVEEMDLTQEVLPNMRRHRKICNRIIAFPRLCRIISSRWPGLMQHWAAGVMMAPLTEGGAYSYRLLVLEPTEETTPGASS